MKISSFNIKYKKNGVFYNSRLLKCVDYEIIETTLNNVTTITIKTYKPLDIIDVSVDYEYKYTNDSTIYLNGYQSWTDSKEITVKENVKSIKGLPRFIKNSYHLEGYGDYNIVDYKKGEPHSFTYTYIKDKTSLLIGSYNMDNAYLIIKHLVNKNIIRLFSDVNGLRIDGDFQLFKYTILEGDLDSILDKYLSVFKTGIENKKLRGYTSWYNHYQDINEEKIETALLGINKENYDLFQIDDGFEEYVGDWLKIDMHKFPNGLKPIVDKIHEKGLLAGIWLAPFVCEIKSDIYNNHKDFLYLEDNKPVYAGCNWSGDVVLDFRKPEVKDYIKTVLEYYIDLGFDFFKLDFLYAIALIRDSSKTRGAIMREGMKFLREILKDKLILGCGVPLEAAFSLVDYCRIGPDVSLKFDDLWYMKYLHRERISTKVTLQNTIYRNHLDNYVFRCDPDVYILRDDNIELSNEQKKALLYINHLCGSLYLSSDNVSEYTSDKQKLLANAKELVGSKILDIRKHKEVITIKYRKDNVISHIKYDIKKGVLISG